MSDETQRTMTTETRDSLMGFGGEITGGSGLVRAVSAWLAISDDDASYTPHDEEAPYELRDAVGTEIGWEASMEGLADTNGEIERYRDYIDLRHIHGVNWPLQALHDYLAYEKKMPAAAETCAHAIWRDAVEAHSKATEAQRLRHERRERMKQDAREAAAEVCL